MADLTTTTTLVNGDVFDPQVVSDMINAKVEKKAVMTQLPQLCDVDEIKVFEPSLNDIFVEYAGENI